MKGGADRFFAFGRQQPTPSNRDRCTPRRVSHRDQAGGLPDAAVCREGLLWSPVLPLSESCARHESLHRALVLMAEAKRGRIGKRQASLRCCQQDDHRA